MIRTVQLVVSKRIFARLRARIRYNLKRCKMNAILMSLLIFSVIQDGFFVHITLSLLIQMVYFNLKKTHIIMIHVSDFLFVLFYIVLRKSVQFTVLLVRKISCVLTLIFQFFLYFYICRELYINSGYLSKKNQHLQFKMKSLFKFSDIQLPLIDLYDMQKSRLKQKKMNISLRHN